MLLQHPEERAAQANAPTSSLLPMTSAKLTLDVKNRKDRAKGKLAWILPSRRQRCEAIFWYFGEERYHVFFFLIHTMMHNAAKAARQRQSLAAPPGMPRVSVRWSR